MTLEPMTLEPVTVEIDGRRAPRGARDPRQAGPGTTGPGCPRP